VKPDIFSYVNYRQYLQDYYDAAKRSSQVFSFRYFARKAGYASPNFLKLVINGDRNLGPESIGKFAKALGLNPEEKRFFESLVIFDQAKSQSEKTEAFERVTASRRFRQARRIDSAAFEYLSHWYYPAIREMAGRSDFRPDARWIATQLLPSIKVSEAQRALDLLFELGLLFRDAEGQVSRGEASLTTGHEVHTLAVAAFHRQMLDRASESIELVPREVRDISALTICIEAETIADVKERIHNLREHLLDRCDRDQDPSCVYQLNIQFFPLTRTGNGSVSAKSPKAVKGATPQVTKE